MPITLSTTLGYFYIGDQVSDAIQVKNAAGTLTNATVVCTIYLPDNTNNSPSVTNGSTGNYSITYTPTIAGMHTIRWVATGTVVAANEHIFVVKKGATG